mmetsp:Transcript_420/g.491  ORF Transcript_420/g.491 Transcript_420/m.491 type:complete len:148 (+) Transcript_420:96-539(+)
MGRRAKKAPVQTKKRATLAKTFKCPFCANDNVVECKMDFRKGTGSLACRVCDSNYQMPIHHLHEPVDVFSEWLDDCEAAQRPQEDRADDDGQQSPRYDDEDEEEIPESSGLDQSGGSFNSKPKSSSRETPSFGELGLDDSDDSDDEE